MTRLAWWNKVANFVVFTEGDDDDDSNDSADMTQKASEVTGSSNDAPGTSSENKDSGNNADMTEKGDDDDDAPSKFTTKSQALHLAWCSALISLFFFTEGDDDDSGDSADMTEKGDDDDSGDSADMSEKGDDDGDSADMTEKGDDDGDSDGNDSGKGDSISASVDSGSSSEDGTGVRRTRVASKRKGLRGR